ncbi:MAG: 16S rRNA (cytosine(1402)-N(4))-methyltransferase RsmH [Erysipelotrichales bacterium]|nr:MAG: 16S rRNA (cytosine(1402)-N(4))-methyltransferase RsmH [Erysipelotrichales bacterium]
MEHISVLLQASIAGLNIKPDGIYVDATLGRGGHSLLIVEQLTSGRLYCFDRDVKAIEESRITLTKYLDKITFIKANFAQMEEKLHELNITGVDGILIDLGVSSPQFDDPQRGFSYRNDARLDMRMDQSQTLDAWEVVNNYPFNDLMRIISRYGEESYAKQISRKIEARRQIQTIDTTLDLVDVIKSALPSKVLSKKGHPAKQTFQAIRIEVNGELDALGKVLEQGIDLLRPDGRFCVITFHSLEDRIVKEKFNEVSTIKVPRKLPIAELPQADYETLTRKALVADEEELQGNKRSHSAKLRILRKRGIYHGEESQKNPFETF